MIQSLMLMIVLAAPPDAQWKPFEFLLGDWVGEGTGGAGAFSFEPALGGKVLVRKNHSGEHEDMLVVSRKSPAAPYRATYWDNEGHVMEYTVTATDAPATLLFVSDANPNEPRFRLTYTQTARGAVSIVFEIAPPGKPEAFGKYLEGRARRR